MSITFFGSIDLTSLQACPSYEGNCKVRMTEHSTAKNFSRPLRSRFEGWPNCVTGGAEDDVDGIASATFEIAAAEMTLCLHMLPSAPP
jgi:hypothetical protein